MPKSPAAMPIESQSYPNCEISVEYDVQGPQALYLMQGITLALGRALDDIKTEYLPACETWPPERTATLRRLGGFVANNTALDYAVEITADETADITVMSEVIAPVVDLPHYLLRQTRRSH